MVRRVIGLGQRAAGDDGVGLAVLSRLRERGAPPGVELLELAEATGLLPLLEAPGLMILVDAVLGAAEGEVLRLRPEALEERALRPLSTHGVGLLAVLELARALSAGLSEPRLWIVAIGIARPGEYRLGLSPAVSAAISRATAEVLSLLEAEG